MILTVPTSPLVRFNGGGRIKMAQDMCVFWEMSRDRILIPEGSTSDLASVPRWLRPLFPKIGENSIPSIIHDQIYDTGEVSKEEADFIFLDALRHYGVKPWRAKAMYLAVHWFGQKVWDDCREKDNK